MGTAQLVSGLTRPQAYPHLRGELDEIIVRQTHISVLFFAGDRVYKVKKPVDMGFLDYRDLDERRCFCHEEVRLNRRARNDPEVHLGVRLIVRNAEAGLRIGEEDAAYPDPPASADVIDYAVEMIRLPAARMLSCLLDRGEIDNELLDAIAEKLVGFHGECPTGAGVDEHASPQSLRRQVDETFDKLESAAPELVPHALLDRLRSWCGEVIKDNESLLRKRMNDGRIREGHGDLHSENICVLSRDRQQPSIILYDCIEFTRRFRCRDVACEVAFLAMDMDFRGCRGFAQYLMRTYAALAGDDDGFDRLLSFYKLKLAMVRSMVEAVRSRDAELKPAERDEAAARARRYAHLAATYAVRPALIMTCGLPGSGKSWAARAVAAPFEALIVRSDAIRKGLAGLAPTQDASNIAPHIYRQAFTSRTYAAMLERAAETLRSGRAVVADATFAAASLREPFIDLARRLDVPWVLIHTDAPEEEIRRRMALRSDDPSEVSDADWRIYTLMRSNWQSPDEIPAEHLVRIGPECGDHEVAGFALAALIALAQR